MDIFKILGLKPTIKEQVLLSIEITDTVIYWVRVLTHKNGPTLLSHGRILLPEDVVFKGEIFNQRKLHEVLKPLHAFSKDSVRIVVPFDQSVSEHVAIGNIPNKPQLAQKHIEKELSLYLKNHLDIDDGKMVCEYDVIKSDFDKKEAHVYMTLYDSVVLQEFTLIFKTLGFKNISLHTITHSTARLVSDARDAFFIHIEEGRASGVLSVKGRIAHMFNIPFGTETLSHIIEKYLGVEQKDARRIIERHGVSQSHRDSELLRLLQSNAHVLCSTIQGVLKDHSYEVGDVAGSFEKTPEIPEVYIFGSSSRIKGLIPFMNEHTASMVGYFDIWRQFPQSSFEVPQIDANEVMHFIPVLAVALDK